jgi:hypothetical protein
MSLPNPPTAGNVEGANLQAANSDYAAALWSELWGFCPGTGRIEKVNSIVVTEERLDFAIKALQNCA